MENLTPSELIEKAQELRRKLDEGMLEPHEREELKDKILEINQILNDKL